MPQFFVNRSDRPDFIVAVPDGGYEIQDTPVHWTLPCGREVCMSLREFMDSKVDQLTLGCTDEANGFEKGMAIFSGLQCCGVQVGDSATAPF